MDDKQKYQKDYLARKRARGDKYYPLDIDVAALREDIVRQESLHNRSETDIRSLPECKNG